MLPCHLPGIALNVISVNRLVSDRDRQRVKRNTRKWLGARMPENLLRDSFEPLSERLRAPANEYTERMMKDEVVEILRSYHQTYDHLQELLQNAVDACEDAYDLYLREGQEARYDLMIHAIFDLAN